MMVARQFITVHLRLGVVFEFITAAEQPWFRVVFFFFQAEDGIRDLIVTGVQTCALPIRSEEHTSELQSQAEDGIRDLIVTGVQTCALPIQAEEHTSELQSRSDLVCRLLLGSEEHTSELQSRSDLVCRLLLEKKKKTHHIEYCGQTAERHHH